jgi:hypothetical protein
LEGFFHQSGSLSSSSVVVEEEEEEEGVALLLPSRMCSQLHFLAIDRALVVALRKTCPNCRKGFGSALFL